MTDAPKIFSALAAVTLDLTKEGIGKDRLNEQQRYKFRGIDDIYNALAPLLAKHGVVIIPTVLKREVLERATQKGGLMFSCTLEVRWSLICAEDGSMIEAVTYGEAMDSGDKATNKAMSAAYKYMALLTFCIPTEGDNDAEATTHVVVQARAPREPLAAHNRDAMGSRLTAAEAKRRGADADVKKAIQGCDLAGLLDWGENFESYTAHLPLGWQDSIRDMIEARRIEIMGDEVVYDDSLDEAFRETMRN